jgi:hypothetical protein
MTLAGLALPGVGLVATLSVVRAGNLLHITNATNGSLAGLFSSAGLESELATILGAGIAALIWIIGMRRINDDATILGWTILCALLASPLSWGLYWLAALPIGARLISTGPKAARILAGASVALILISFPGVGLLASGLVLLAALLLVGAPVAAKKPAVER